MSTPSRTASSSLWLQLLLVGALASVAILVVQTVRTARSGQEVAARALGDYGAFAAWSYREHLVAELRAAADETLGAVNHGEGMHVSPKIPSAQDMGHFLPWDERCACHTTEHGPLPMRFYAFTLGSDTLAVGRNYETAKPGWLADPMPGTTGIDAPTMPVSKDEARWLNATLTRVSRAHSATAWGYRVTVDRLGDTNRMLVSRSMATTWGDTVVYAYEYSPRAIDSLFHGILARSDLLPSSLVAEGTNADIIDVQVAHAEAGPLFRSRATDDWTHAAVNVLPAEFGSLQVTAQIRPELGEALLIGGVPESRVPVMLVMLVLALGLTALAAVQLRRDVRFASDRARFVANVSHELRTPLAQVRLVLDTVRLGREGDATMFRSALELADREVLRLQHLVEGLLRFTRGPRQADVPRLETDIADEVRRTAAEFQPLATPRGIRIEVTGAETLVTTLQRGALRQILLNLLDNAVKYGRDDSTVRVEVAETAGVGPRLSVLDEGPGVPADERRRIFRAFERGAQAQARAAGGSGIGLTIVRDIALEHGGDAWVEDAPGGGARFVVQFPERGKA